MSEIRPPMRTWEIYWSPEGRLIATVRASTPRIALSRAPKPYRRYRGELYAVDITPKPSVTEAPHD